MPAPANDAFGSATDLGDDPTGTVTGTNVAATIEMDEPDTGGYGDITVWWHWTCPADLTEIIFDTHGSHATGDPGTVLDTVLFAYSGPPGAAITDLVLIDYNDDDDDHTSELLFAVTPGDEYWIKVDGYDSGEAGDIILSWAPPPPPIEVEFEYTGAVQEFVVPDGYCSIYFELIGAAVLIGSPGQPAYLEGRYPVTPGDTVYVYVGGRGESANPGPAAGGWNGGGDSGSPYLAPTGGNTYSGGGATDLRVGGTALADRVAVAGAVGGDDVHGGDPDGGGDFAVEGATQSAPGQGGPGESFTLLDSSVVSEPDGSDGTLGVGGAGATPNGTKSIFLAELGSPIPGEYGGYGGGGGYYGGGGGGGAPRRGGGGSSWIKPGGTLLLNQQTTATGSRHGFAHIIALPCTAAWTWGRIKVP